MPSKGEKHPVVETITEIERTIRRSEERDEVNWGVMRKQVQQQRMQLNLIRAKEYMQAADLVNLQNVIDSLYSYVEGNWHLYEMDADPVVAKRLYAESMSKIEGLSNQKFAFTVTLDHSTEDTKNIDMSKSVQELYKQVQNQNFEVQKQYGLS